MAKPRKRHRPHTAQKTPAPRGIFAGLRFKIQALKLSHSARRMAAVLEERSIRAPKLPVIMIGYGCRSQRSGFAEESNYSRRHCIRAIEELERAGIVTVGEDRNKEGRRGRIKASCGWRHKWMQRRGGRTPEGPGRANEYAPGPALGQPVAASTPMQALGDGEDTIERRRQRIKFWEQLAGNARQELRDKGYDP